MDLDLRASPLRGCGRLRRRGNSIDNIEHQNVNVV